MQYKHYRLLSYTITFFCMAKYGQLDAANKDYSVKQTHFTVQTREQNPETYTLSTKRGTERGMQGTWLSWLKLKATRTGNKQISLEKKLYLQSSQSLVNREIERMKQQVLSMMNPINNENEWILDKYNKELDYFRDNWSTDIAKQLVNNITEKEQQTKNNRNIYGRYNLYNPYIAYTILAATIGIAGYAGYWYWWKNR